MLHFYVHVVKKFPCRFSMSTGWERISDRRTCVGKSERVLLVAWDGDVLENQVISSGYAEG